MNCINILKKYILFLGVGRTIKLFWIKFIQKCTWFPTFVTKKKLENSYSILKREDYRYCDKANDVIKIIVDYKLETCSEKISEKEIKIAKQNGISCFALDISACNESTVLPVDIFKKYDFQFCINIDVNVIDRKKTLRNELLKLFQEYYTSTNYLKINEKPVVLINVENITSKRTRNCIYSLIEEIYQVTPSFLITNCSDIKKEIKNVNLVDEYPNKHMEKYGKRVFCIDAVRLWLVRFYNLDLYIKNKKYLNHNDEIDFLSVTSGFDGKYNGKFIKIIDFSPNLFQLWLTQVLFEQELIKKEKYIFLKSWNNYKNGTYLYKDDAPTDYLYAINNAYGKYREGYITDYVKKKITDNKEKGYLNRIYIHCVESLGDVVACEPIARYLRTIDRTSKISWIIKKQYSEIVKYNPNIDDMILVTDLKESCDLCQELSKDSHNIIVDCHYNRRTSSNALNPHVNYVNPEIDDKTYLYYDSLLEVFSLAAGLPPIKDAPVFWERDNIFLEVPNKYVVFHCKSADKDKDWVDKKWNVLANKLFELGIDVVEIGFHNCINSENIHYHNYTFIRDIQAIAHVIKRSVCFIGIDSGFAHIANCYKKKAVLLYGEYKGHRNYSIYTGAYRKDNYADIVHSSSGSVKEIRVEDVLEAIYTRVVSSNKLL